MLACHEIVATYARVTQVADDMLEAARNGDWDLLVQLETRYAAEVATLRQAETSTLSDDAQRHVAAQIAAILERDCEIRTLTLPHIAQLSGLINNSSTERKLRAAYSSPA